MRPPAGRPARSPADDLPHPGAAAEGWELEVAGPGGTGSVRLVRAGTTMAYIADFDLVGLGHLVVADEAVAVPRKGLDLRADGLWTSFQCETPLEHWTFGLEAFGLRLDGPVPPGIRWSDLVGERLAVGYDLEWEATGPPEDLPDGDGFHQPGTLHGEVMVVGGGVAVAASARRTRWWHPFDPSPGGTADPSPPGARLTP